MASINDLATAATIASSSAAMDASPKQETAQPADSMTTTAQSPEAPASPPAPSAALPVQAPTPVQPAAGPPQTSPPIAASAPVLAAPQITQSPAEAQIPAPAPVMEAPASTADDAMEGVTVTEKPKPVRGAFIVFEGMDRAGKTTQAKLLQVRCIEDGRDVVFMRFPDRNTPIGKMIDSYLKGESEIEDHVIHLLFSANRWEAVKKINAALAAGTTIICDRYYHSGIVYSAAKQSPTLSLAWAKAPEIGLPRPDLVLFLDLEEKVARERGGWGGEVYEKGEMQRRVRELFWGLSMGDLGKDAGPGHATPGGPTKKDEYRQEQEDLQIIDANMGIEELSEKVWEYVLPRLDAVAQGEVGKVVRIVR